MYFDLDTLFTGTYKYSAKSNSSYGIRRQANTEILQIIPLKPRMPQVEDQRWYSLTAVVIIIYFILTTKFIYSNFDDLKKANAIVWEEIGKVRGKIPVFSKFLRVYKGSKVIRDVTLL